MKVIIRQKPDKTYEVNIERACCDPMKAALQKQFVVVIQARPDKPPVIAFRAPGETMTFKFCPWCGEVIVQGKASGLVIPGVEVPVDLRGSRTGEAEAR